MDSVLMKEKEETIIVKFLPVIKYIAYRRSWNLPPHIGVKDLISFGLIGLMDAINKFESDKGAKLKTYAEPRIKGAMIDELRKASFVSRSARRNVKEINNARDNMKSENGREPTDEEVAGRLKISIKKFHERLLLVSHTDSLRFGDFNFISTSGAPMNIKDCIADPKAENPLNLLIDKEMRSSVVGLMAALPSKQKIVMFLYYWKELTMGEIGKLLKVTESRICQIHRDALKELKGELKLSSGGIEMDIFNRRNRGNGKK